MFAHRNGLAPRTPCRAFARRGLTTVELLVAVGLVSILLTAAYNLLNASWRSYQNLVWQNRVNQECRQVLDVICDDLRMAGRPSDRMEVLESRVTDDRAQVMNGSSHNTVQFARPNTDTITYEVRERTNADGTKVTMLNRRYGNNISNADMTGQFISTVEFTYEYRTPSNGALNTNWNFVRIGSLPDPDAVGYNVASDPRYLVNTVYVTATSSFQPEGAGGKVYSRTMTSAVNLRAPYNRLVPFAQVNGPAAVAPPAP